MSEINKTLLFFGLAVAAVALAVLTRPSTKQYNVDEMRGQPLFSDAVFENDAARRLRVTSVNSETGEQRVFEVTEQNGIWTIPSKSGYPADATEQMGEAVEGLSGKTILQVVSSDSGDHAQFGVADPTDSKATEGQGTRVQLFDDKDKPLADLIIGKEDSHGNYYVRKGGQDHVYLAKVDLENFSSNFRDWIEKDLLDLNPMDVAGVVIDDYTFQVVETREGLRPMEERRARMKLAVDETTNKWKAEKLESYDRAQKQYVPFELGEDEELNEDALRELKNALDDLEIVDVERKPQGLSADLQAGKEFMTNEEAKRSLYMRGFTPVLEDDVVQLRSTEGEIVCTLKNGVEYVLRFGDLQLDLSGEGDQAKKPKKEGEERDEEESPEGVSRYMFVMARFNEGVIKKPELEPLPELPEGAEEEAATDTEESAEVDQPGEASGEEATPGEGEEGEEDAAGGDVSADQESADGGADDAAAKLAEIKKQRETVQKANEKREKEYQDKLAEGRKAVERLNARFGDWFYVISNDVFKKIHLGRDQVIRKQDTKEETKENATGNPLSGLPDFGLGTEDDATTPPAGETPADTPVDSPSETPGDDASETPEGEPATPADEAPAGEGPSEEPAGPPSTEAAEPPSEGEATEAPAEGEAPAAEPPGA